MKLYGEAEYRYRQNTIHVQSTPSFCCQTSKTSSLQLIALCTVTIKKDTGLQLFFFLGTDVLPGIRTAWMADQQAKK